MNKLAGKMIPLLPRSFWRDLLGPLVAASASGILLGCSSTAVPSPLLQQQHSNDLADYVAVGTQYLLMIPFATVFAPEPRELLQHMFEEQWPTRPVPVVRAASLNLTAYDLFLTRYLTCSMPVLIRCPSGVHQPQTISFSEYSRFGFGNDLSRTLYRCLKKVLQESCSQEAPTHEEG